MTKGEISMRIVTLFTNYYSIYGELLIIISHSRGMLEKKPIHFWSHAQSLVITCKKDALRSGLVNIIPIFHISRDDRYYNVLYKFYPMFLDGNLNL